MHPTPVSIATQRSDAATTVSRERLAELTAGAAPTNFAEAVAAEGQRQAGERDRIKAGESPFVVHRDKIMQCHSTALRLQAVVLNLYNDGVWAKKAPVYLSSLLANADDEHVQVLLDLLRGYARRGENDRDFLALGHTLAVARQSRRGRK